MDAVKDGRGHGDGWSFIHDVHKSVITDASYARVECARKLLVHVRGRSTLSPKMYAWCSILHTRTGVVFAFQRCMLESHPLKTSGRRVSRLR